MKNESTLSKIAAVFICAALSAGLAGCGSSGSNGGSEKEPVKTESAVSEPVAEEKQAEPDTSEDSAPADDKTDTAPADSSAPESVAVEEKAEPETSEKSGSESDKEHFKGTYSSKGLEFTVPDGWYAEEFYSGALLRHDSADGGETSEYEFIEIGPSHYWDIPYTESGGIDMDGLSVYYKTQNGYGFEQSEIVDSGTVSACGREAEYFEVRTTPASKKDDREIYHIRYIVIPGDNSHCILLFMRDTEESQKMMQETFESFADTIKLPTAEQIEENKEKYEKKAYAE